MIKTIHIELHAANPQMPLMPIEPFTGSAASFVICNVPRPIGNRTITGVAVSVKNVAGTQTSFAAVRNGSAWCATVSAAAIGASGTVQNGVLIVASGKDDANNDASWVIGAGDLVVHATDGSVAPGTSRQTVYWFDTVPASPSKGAIAKVDGTVKIYDGTEWISMGGGGSGDVKHSDFTNVTALGDRYGLADIKGKVNEMLGILKGTTAALAIIFATSAFGDVTVQTARLDALYNDSMVVTNATMTETDPTATAKAQAAIAAAGCVTTNENEFFNVSKFVCTTGGDTFGMTPSSISWNFGGGSIFTLNPTTGFFVGDYQHNYLLPNMDGYGTDYTHDIALRSQIPTSSDYIAPNGTTNSVDQILAAARTDSASILTNKLLATFALRKDGSIVDKLNWCTNQLNGIEAALTRILEGN